MRVLLVFLLAAAPAVADPLIETKWIVGPDGSSWIWPNVTYRVEQRRPARFIGVGVIGEDAGLPRSILGTGPVGLMLLALPGQTDRASLVDAETHFEKLGLGTTDEDVLARIAAEPETFWGPALRRAELDRLLAVRLAGRRKLAAAAPVLEALAKNADIDPFLRRAAREERARLAGAPMPGLRTRSLLAVLPDVPRDAQLVVLLDQREVPRWVRPWEIAYEAGLAEARDTLARLGAAVNPADRAAAQCIVESFLETQYEIARQLGNHRIDWAVLAFRKDAVWAHLDGVFELDPLRIELSRGGSWDRSDEADRVRAENFTGSTESALDATRERMRVRVGGERPGGDDARLAEEGILDQDAVWIRLRDPAIAPAGPALAGVKDLTLRVRFEGGTSIRADLTFESDDAAGRWKTWLASLPGEERAGPFVELLRGVQTQQDGARLRASLTFEGKTPEQLLEQVAKAGR